MALSSAKDSLRGDAAKLSLREIRGVLEQADASDRSPILCRRPSLRLDCLLELVYIHVG